MEIDLVNDYATKCGFPIDDNHYFEKNGVFNGLNVYVYVDATLIKNGIVAPTGYPSYIVVNGNNARFLELDEINEYWGLKD